jgi:hypothetical protein
MLLGPRSIAVSHRVVLCIAQFPDGSVGAVRVVWETEACSLCPDDSVLGGNGRYTPLKRDATNALRKRSTATGIPLSLSVPSARQTHWPSSTTTPSSDIAAQMFRVIHPFHPWGHQAIMIIFSGRLCDLLVMDKQRFAYFSLLAPKAPRRFRSGQESGRVFGPYGSAGSHLSRLLGISIKSYRWTNETKRYK